MFTGLIDDSALTNIAEARECACCGAKGEKLRRCTDCRAVWYCSARCQSAHWHDHQPKCKGCANCKKKDVQLHRCAACRGAWYCSVDCQRADWPRHKCACRRGVKTASAAITAGLCAAVAAVLGTV